jgi:CRP/FNR family transcriptional regulator, dissimilatory nitrate respiration regulator
MEPSELKNIYLFSGLNENDYSKLMEICKCKTLKKGDIIFFDTEPYKGFYAVIKGLVKIYKISKDGKEHILNLVSPYNTFAEVPLLENAGKILSKDFSYPANAKVLEDETEVLLMPARQFVELMQNDPSLCLKLVAGLSQRLRHLNKHIEEITLKDITGRVASYIIDECEHHKSDNNSLTFALSISKIDLAAYLGTIPETLSRTFKKLQDEDIINVDGKTIIVKNINKLRETYL